MTTAKKAKKKYRAFVPSITNTTRHDTITMEQWHKWRDAEHKRFLKEKEEKENDKA